MDDLSDLIWNNAGAKKPAASTATAQHQTGTPLNLMSTNAHQNRQGSPAHGQPVGLNNIHSVYGQQNTNQAQSTIPKGLPNKIPQNATQNYFAQNGPPALSPKNQNFVPTASQKPNGLSGTASLSSASIGKQGSTGAVGASVGSNQPTRTPQNGTISPSKTSLDPFGNLLNFGSASGQTSPVHVGSMEEQRLAKEAEISRRKNEETMRGYRGGLPGGGGGTNAATRSATADFWNGMTNGSAVGGGSGDGLDRSRTGSPATLTPRKVEGNGSASQKQNVTTVTAASTASSPRGDAFSSLLHPTPLHANHALAAETIDRKNTPMNYLRAKSPVNLPLRAATLPNATSAQSWDLDYLAAPAPVHPTTAEQTLAGVDDVFDMGVFEKAVDKTTSLNVDPPSPASRSLTPSSNPANVFPKAPTPAPSPLVNGNFDHLVAQMMEMGYELDEAQAALAASGGQSIQAALDLIAQQRAQLRKIDSTGSVKEGIDDAPSPPMPRRKFSYKDDEGNFSEDSRHHGRASGHNNNHNNKNGEGSLPHGSNADKLLATASFLGKSVFAKATTLVKQGQEKVKAAVSEVQSQLREYEENGGKKGPAPDGRPRWMTDTSAIYDADGEENNVGIKDSSAGFHDSEESLSTDRRPQQRTPTTHQNHNKPAPAHDAPIPSDRAQAPAPAAATRQPPRPVISCDATAAKDSERHKNAGNDHFKLGRYADADASYTLAIDALPAHHPYLIPLYANRALARLKTGEYRSAMEDATRAIDAIGRDHLRTPEEIGPGGAGVAFSDLFVKARVRRAQAWEGMEKYEEALEDYRVAGAASSPGDKMLAQSVARCQRAVRMNVVNGESGSGGGGGSAGATRREEAATTTKVSAQEELLAMFDDSHLDSTNANKVAPTNMSTKKAEIVTQANASLDPFGLDAQTDSAAGAGAASSGQKGYGQVTTEEINNSARVNAIRAEAAEAEREDEEKLAAKDDVDGRINLWKGRKENNIRALIASLDTVLWPELDWKPVGLHELVTTGNVKVKYMRAIGRLHPDKLNNVTAEQKLIAQGVFSALNEAWNAFKTQNNI